MQTLKQAYKDYFDIGAAVAHYWLDEAADTIKDNFTSITCENEMKYMGLHPHNIMQPPFGTNPDDFKAPDIGDMRDEFIHPNKVVGTYGADKIYNFARDNGLKIRGHALSWHASYPLGYFEQLTPEELMQNTEEHYKLVSELYPECFCWDVVNEAVDDKHGLYLRDTVYKQKFGEDYLYTLYGMARKYFPDKLLVCNDYNEWAPHKHQNILKLVNSLKERGLVDVIGCQCHISAFTDDRQFDDIKRAYENYANTGLKIHITEMDVNCVDWRERKPVDEKTLEKQASVYEKMFALFRQYKGAIENVTLWGVSNKHTWLNFFKNDGIKNYPLLFDDDYKPTEAYLRITQF